MSFSNVKKIALGIILASIAFFWLKPKNTPVEEPLAEIPSPEEAPPATPELPAAAEQPAWPVEPTPTAELSPQALPIVKVSAASQGLEIMGSIINKEDMAQSVSLIKILETGKVTAVRPGFTLQLASGTFPIVEISTEDEGDDYIAVRDDPGQRIVRIMKSPFVDNTPVAQKGIPIPPKVEGFSDTYREDGFERNKDKIALTSAYRDDLIKNQLQKILMQASAEPYIENGAITGFVMDDLEPGSIFLKSGLANGDIITNINDVPLNGIPSTIKLLNSLRGASEVGVDLMRGGQKYHVTISVQ